MTALDTSSRGCSKSRGGCKQLLNEADRRMERPRNNRLQWTALRTTADTERWTAKPVSLENEQVSSLFNWNISCFDKKRIFLDKKSLS